MLTFLHKTFLLVDDDADDAGIFCEALGSIDLAIKCYTVENGLELFSFLSNEDFEKPDFIFLDINMPVMNGWDCLRQLKRNAEFVEIPVVMYSTSSAQKDIELAYNLGAILFVTKPEDFRELTEILKIVVSSSADSLIRQLKRFESVKFN